MSEWVDPVEVPPPFVISAGGAVDAYRSSDVWQRWRAHEEAIREREIAYVTELNAALPFAHPIARYCEPLVFVDELPTDFMDAMAARLRESFRGQIIHVGSPTDPKLPFPRVWSDL